MPKTSINGRLHYCWTEIKYSSERTMFDVSIGNERNILKVTAMSHVQD